MSRARAAGLVLGLVLLSGALRFPLLAARPMHADEAIHADRVGTLLEGGGYKYDPKEYHGPTLVYMALVPAALRGQWRYVDLDETTLRLVPAVIGVALVLAHLAAAPYVGPAAAAVGALLAALSPAMVYYSRYYIHELPLVCMSLGALLAGAGYLRRPSAGTAVFGGVCAGLMVATKETAPLALASMAVAFAAVGGLGRSRPSGPGSGTDAGPDRPPDATRRLPRHLALAVLAGVAVAAPFFSSFFTHPAGLVDAFRAYGYYLHRGSNWSWHVHPWHYYLGLLLRFPASGTPFWTEALILVLAAVGAVAGWRAPQADPAVARRALVPDSRVVRFLVIYTLLMLFGYSSIPYKTPWCVLGFLDGIVLLAGVGAVVLVRLGRGTAVKAAVVLLLAAGGAHLGWEAWTASFRFAADQRNPWVYAHTSPDVHEIVAVVEDLARAHPAGSALSVQVISGENVWPLPWYLRRFPNVAWWTGVSDAAGNAPVILATPDMEPALVRRMYELPPPGERELYVSIYPRTVNLRPAVEIRGYAANRLWDAHLRQEAP
jgi:uncharacterized protein (TIGR03663 family)